MRFLYPLWLFLLMLILQACAQGRIEQEVQTAKVHFKAGNYKQAFHELLPAAAEGDASAQYAVGYMYYYGFGAPRDSESGIFWMRKAAEQNDSAAKKALVLIDQAEVSQPEKPVRSADGQGRYSLQLFGAYELAAVEKMREEQHLQKQTRIRRTERAGKTWYVLLYGRYQSILEANQAKDELPLNIRNLEPWVRDVNGLERF